MIPESLSAAVKQAGINPANVCLAAMADMSSDGSYRETWLLTTADTVLIFSMPPDSKNKSRTTKPAGDRSGSQDDRIPVLERRYAFSDIRKLEALSLVGGGMVRVWRRGTGEVPREVLRFSSARESFFSAVVRRLARRLGAEEDPTDPKCRTKEADPETPPAPDDADDKRNPLHFEDILRRARERICPKCRGQLQEGTKVCPACVSSAKTLLRILAFAAPFKWRMALLCVLMVVGVGIALLPPMLIRFFVDEILAPKKNLDLIPWVVFGLLAVKIIGTAMRVWQGRVAVVLGARITQSIRSLAFQHLELLSLGWFSRQKTGQLMSRITSDTGRLQGFLTDGIQFTVVNLLQIVGIAAVLLYLNPFLGVLVLLPAPLVILASKFLWKRIGIRFRKEWEAWGRLSAFLNDALNGIRVVKAFGRERAEVERFEDKNVEYADRAVEAEKFWQTCIPFLTLLFTAGEVLVWYFGAREVVGDDSAFTLGDLMAYLGYLGMLHGPLMLVARLNEWLARAMTGAERVFEILDMEPEITDKPDAKPLPRIEGRVAFRKVRFGYEKHKPVLFDVNFEIQPGEMIGLVGRSGAGKSTFINLLARLFDPDEGAVEIDGEDLRNIRAADLRRQIGVVLQETFLFGGSIYENLIFADPDCDRERVLRAAFAANAHEFIMSKPDAYDSQVGERGQQLSGGERQRLSIARAVIHDPRVLILDEATSTVDVETEKKIQDALRRLIRGRTTIAIAHRLATLRDANRLVVLDKGRIAEVGSHAELTAKENGVYRKLVDIQTNMNQIIAYKG